MEDHHVYEMLNWMIQCKNSEDLKCQEKLYWKCKWYFNRNDKQKRGFPIKAYSMTPRGYWRLVHRMVHISLPQGIIFKKQNTNRLIMQHFGGFQRSRATMSGMLRYIFETRKGKLLSKYLFEIIWIYMRGKSKRENKIYVFFISINIHYTYTYISKHFTYFS